MVIKRRNGTSLTTKPAVMANPKVSFKINRSGGRSHPVRPGEISRAIQPEGAIRKASPKAAAACGTDKSGESNFSRNRNARVPDHPPAISATIRTDRPVASSPVVTDSRVAVPIPGVAKRARNGSRDGPSKPATGKWPKAGKTVPHSPAITGPSIASRVAIGMRVMARGIVVWRPYPYCALP